MLKWTAPRPTVVNVASCLGLSDTCPSRGTDVRAAPTRGQVLDNPKHLLPVEASSLAAGQSCQHWIHSEEQTSIEVAVEASVRYPKRYNTKPIQP